MAWAPSRNIMKAMRLEQAVSRDPEVVSGALCFRGTRVPVSTLWVHLEKGKLADFFEDFLGVTQEMVQAVLEASEDLVERTIPLKKSA